MSAEADTQAATEAGLAAAAGMDDNEGAEILLAMLGLAPEGAQKQARGLGGGRRLDAGKADMSSSHWCFNEVQAPGPSKQLGGAGYWLSPAAVLCSTEQHHRLPAPPCLLLPAAQARSPHAGQPCHAPLPSHRVREVQGRARGRPAGAVRPLRQGLAPVLPVAAAVGAARQGLGLPRVPLQGWVCSMPSKGGRWWARLRCM